MSSPNRLRAARLRVCLTQQELADRAGVSGATVSYCERGAVPSPPVQRALAAALNVAPSALWQIEPTRDQA